MLKTNSILLLLALLVMAGCTSETDQPAAPPADPPASADNHDHDGEHGHEHGDAHDHGDAHAHDHGPADAPAGDHSHGDAGHEEEHTSQPAPAPVSEPAAAEVTSPAPAPATSDSSEAQAIAPGEAQAAMEALAQGLSKGEVGPVWDALPAAWQKDVTEIVQGTGNAMDPALWGQVTGVISKLHSVIDTKADFIVGSPMVAQSGNAEMVKGALPHVAGLLATILDLADLEKMKAFDGAAFFSGPASTLLTQLDGLAALNPEAGKLADVTRAKFETLKEEGDTATLRVTPAKEGASPEELELVRIDGRWVPADLAAGWDEGVASARKQVETLPETLKTNGQTVMMVSGMIGGNLAPLEAAETQEQFDTALTNLQNLLGPMVGSVMQQMAQPAAPAPGPAPTPAQ